MPDYYDEPDYLTGQTKSVCETCGALVGNHEAHDGWHGQQDEVRSLIHELVQAHRLAAEAMELMVLAIGSRG